MRSLSKTNSSRRTVNRAGVTLLFTISMIVLFLLMGTTFVVVANDYFKSSRKRAYAVSYDVDSAAILDQAFYDVFRGPSLLNDNSPLKAQSILEDQYGYGFTLELSDVVDGPTNTFKTLIFKNMSDFTQPPVLTSIRGDGTATFGWAGYIDGIFNGQVLTVASIETQSTSIEIGHSSRIISHALVNTGSMTMPNYEFRVLILNDSTGLDWSSSDDSIRQAARSRNPDYDTAGTVKDETVRVVINGRDFSGTGAGGRLAALDFDGDPTAVAAGLNGQALLPNQAGKTLPEMTTGAAAYIPADNSPNEQYDIPNEQNMFLSGRLADLPPAIPGDPPIERYIPSFHRDRLYLDQFGSGTYAEVKQFSFRPIDGATSNNSQAFGNNQYTGTTFSGDENRVDSLDVDTDGDGTNDAVWIDIGLPIQTDNQGRRFRPLVAYRIIDLDGRLNINAHGSIADQEMGTTARRGSSYGVAEISLLGAVGDDAGQYSDLLNMRYGNLESPPVPGNSDYPLGIGQKLYGHVDSGSVTAGTTPRGTFTSLFSTGGDLFGRAIVGRNAVGFGDDSLPQFTGVSSLMNTAGSISAYAANFSIGGGIGDSFVQPFEMEKLLRSSDSDASLINSRLDSLSMLDADLVTSDSFEVAMPPFSVMQNLQAAIQAEVLASGGTVPDDVRIIARALSTGGYLSNDVLMGGKFNINQSTGNGIDDDGDTVVDEPEELLNNAQTCNDQYGTPVFDLNNGGEAMPRTNDHLAGAIKAKQIYTLLLLITGTDPPAYMTNGGTIISTPEYRRMIAQWAVNIVDFADADSVHTVFEYDINPFNDDYVDANPATTEADAAFVYGVERPELLITEVSAVHERRNQDEATDSGGTNNTVADGDTDWDSTHLPVASTFIELFNPWNQTVNSNGTDTDAFQILPGELDDDPTDADLGVDLGLTAPDGTPVWRIAVKRTRDPADPIIRGVFFTDPSMGDSAALTGGVNFYSSGPPSQNVGPGEYFVFGSSGNTTTGSFTTTFGLLASGTPDVPMTRSVTLDNTPGSSSVAVNLGSSPGAACGVAVIDMPHSFSLSGPDVDYSDTLDSIIMGNPAISRTNTDDSVAISPPLDTPFDAGITNPEDLDAIWTNGVTEGFRFVFLQRLANPQADFNVTANPYITIDVAEVDLLAFNGANSDTGNTGTSEQYAAGSTVSNPGNTEFRTIERGEFMLDDTTLSAASRRTFFRTERTVTPAAGTVVAGDGHNFSFEFEQTLGSRNDAIDTLAGPTEPIGWLVWNNRPYANRMELAHVPFLPNEYMLDYFNFSRSAEEVPALVTSPAAPPAIASTPEQVFAYYMGDDKFGHLLGFGGVSPVADGAGNAASTTPETPVRGAPNTSNRFDIVFDFLDVPSRFIGSELFVPPVGGAYPSTDLTYGLLFNLNAPFNTIPNFREPGRVNINTVNEEEVYDAVIGGFGGMTFDQFRDIRDFEATPQTSASNFPGLFTAASSSHFFSANERPRASGEGSLYFRDPSNTTPEFRPLDFVSADPSTNTESASWFENEFKQRLAATTTTRSSVFAIWITVGYFQVDEFDRLTSELGSDEGEIRRNRAFYMVDRSIPVACEPGKNHNVDKAVLVRTIIE